MVTKEDRDAGLEIVTLPNGREQRTKLTVTVGGETREVEARRLSAGNVWFSDTALVVVRFPTGSKEHVQAPQFNLSPSGRWVASVAGFRNANRCCVVRWATTADKGSGWTQGG